MHQIEAIWHTPSLMNHGGSYHLFWGIFRLKVPLGREPKCFNATRRSGRRFYPKKIKKEKNAISDS
ncbi:hypothetical protein SF83666_d69370 (plasmid) [Sinorhizobium fredii CCBAU 83666]|nr:hypothetical protein SF83666_d69370 [Sinorhizobium fredii CCBAU 83666]